MELEDDDRVCKTANAREDLKLKGCIKILMVARTKNHGIIVREVE